MLRTPCGVVINCSTKIRDSISQSMVTSHDNRRLCSLAFTNRYLSFSILVQCHLSELMHLRKVEGSKPGLLTADLAVFLQSRLHGR